MKKLILLLSMPLLSLGLFAQYTMHQFNYQGVNREYLLYVPAHYDSSQATPFVFVLHGLGDTITNFKGINMNLVADTGNFIFALPQALTDTVLTGATAWNSGAGEFGLTLNPNVDDVGFLNAIIDSVSLYYNIDQTRVYSSGFSMGGFMTNRLGCELNNRIAAIASVSGTIGNGITCNPTRDVPACHFHGTADQTVNYTGDRYGLDAEALVAYWRTHDQCDSTASSIDTLPQHINDGHTYIHYTWPNGNYGTEVEFYKVINGVHEWIDDANINYSVEIWKFFMRFKWAPQVSAITDMYNTISAEVYPNPANDKLVIRTGNFTPQTISIYNLSGQLVQEVKFSPEVNIRRLNPGAYFIEIKAGEQTARKRFVKM
jgi:polyhydroxybutyrate depolymerase